MSSKKRVAPPYKKPKASQPPSPDQPAGGSPLDFGFDPQQSQQHFVVIVPTSTKQDVAILEMDVYDEEASKEAYLADFFGPAGYGKVLLNYDRWSKISTFARVEFNQRMRAGGFRSSHFTKGINRVHRLFGKELMVLAWAIEDADPGKIPQAVENWLGLKPEERWWLYTMTNAATGHPNLGRNKGWRKALRFALTENPVPEGRYTQTLLDDEKLSLFEEENDYPLSKKAT